MQVEQQLDQSVVLGLDLEKMDIAAMLLNPYFWDQMEPVL